MLDFRLYIVKPLFRRSATSTTGTTTTSTVFLFLVSCIKEMDITSLTDADYWLDYLKQEADYNGESLG